MPFHHAIWKVGASPEPLNLSKLATGKEPGDMITARPEILPAEWMRIGRQEKTGFGGIIDLLAIAPDGSLVLIELKRDKTPRVLRSEARLGATPGRWLGSTTQARLRTLPQRHGFARPTHDPGLQVHPGA